MGERASGSPSTDWSGTCDCRAGRSARRSSVADLMARSTPAHAARRIARSSSPGLLGSLRHLGVEGVVPQATLLAVLSLVSGLAQAAILVLVSELAVTEVQGHATFRLIGRTFTSTGGLVAALALLVVFALASTSAALLSSRLAARTLQVARLRIIRGFFGARWSVQSGERLGQIQQQLMGNAVGVTGVVIGGASVLQSLLSLVALLGVAMAVSPLAALGVIGIGLVLVMIMRPLNRRSRRWSEILAGQGRGLGTLITEFTRLAREFRLMGVQPEATEQLEQSVGQVSSTYQRSVRLTQLSPVIYQSVAFAFVIGAVGFVASRGSHNVGALGAVLLLLLRSVNYGSNTQSGIQGIRSSQGFVDDFIHEVDRLDAATEHNRPVQVPESYGLHFDHARYSYDGAHVVLHDVSFAVPAGAIVGIAGPSGSGKTTISQLALGLREPISGGVYIGEVPAANVDRRADGAVTALVPQEPILLQATVAENIAFFRAHGSDEIIRAAQRAHLHDEIMEMPDGYDSLVGEGGGQLSGGQRQRLAIARALIGNPRLIVLDEPSSGLDARSEQMIRRTLRELRGDVTTLIISHRMAMIEDCDWVLRLDHGRVVSWTASSSVNEPQSAPGSITMRNAIAVDEIIGIG